MGMEASTTSPRATAERLFAVIERALSRGLMSFPAFLDEYSRFVWGLRSNANELAIPNRTWRRFTGGSTTRPGDRQSMFISYRNILLAAGVLEELRPADKECRFSGVWRSLLPVPAGPDGPDEAWRIVVELLSNRTPDPFCADEVRRHLTRCSLYMPAGGGRSSELHMSKRNRFRVEQMRTALFLSAKRANPEHTLVSMWPEVDPDKIDSADLALFLPCSTRPAVMIKCGLGNASDDAADAFLKLVAVKYSSTRLIFLSLYEPDPELRSRCDAAGVDVVSILLRRVPRGIPANAEARAAEDAFDQLNP